MNGENQSSMHFLRRRQVLQGAAAALLSVGTRSPALGAEKVLQVGGLPVTCNLTLPVACMASAMNAKPPERIFEFSSTAGGRKSRNR